MLFTLLHLFLFPHLPDVSPFCSLLVHDAVTRLASKDELVIVALDVCRRADGNGKVNCLVRGRAFIKVDKMHLLLYDIEEAQGVGGFIPKRCLTEPAGRLEPWLSDLVFLYLGHCR